MWQFLDVVLIAVAVLLSAMYAVYSLSSVRIKRAILSGLTRVFGVRVFSVLSPRIGGCSGCEGGASRSANVLSKLKKP